MRYRIPLLVTGALHFSVTKLSGGTEGIDTPLFQNLVKTKEGSIPWGSPLHQNPPKLQQIYTFSFRLLLRSRENKAGVDPFDPS